MRGLIGISGVLGSIAGLGGAIDLVPLTRRADLRPIYHGQHRNRTTHFTEGLNGKQAVARRLRQIASGSLRTENGLASKGHIGRELAPDPERWVNGNGGER